MDDRGKVIGVKDTRKLLEDIPNKVRDTLGIMVEVNLHETEEGEYIEIKVEPYPYPVNYKGQYYYRSGSTKQELKGPALDRFLLQKQGKRWDSVPVPGIKIEQLKRETFEFFLRKALNTQRVEKETIGTSPELILENLNLLEGKHLK